MKRLYLKRMVISTLAAMMFLGTTPFSQVEASEKLPENSIATFITISGEDFEIEKLEQYANDLQINLEEIINLEENLKNALSNLGEANNLQRSGTAVQISENLFLTSSVNFEPPLARSNTNITVTAEMQLSNILGMTVVTLRSHATFNFNSGRVSAIDGFTSHIGGLLGNWNSSNQAMSQGAGATAWVRNVFSGQYNFGVDPISITLRSFQFNNTLTATASTGIARSEWR
jgi:hypothetical protein